MNRHEKKVEGVRIRRKMLILAMGGKCEFCGCGDHDRLEFHHTQPRTWIARNAARWVRQRQYEEEWDAGLLQLACDNCNKKLGKPADGPETLEGAPF